MLSVSLLALLVPAQSNVCAEHPIDDDLSSAETLALADLDGDGDPDVAAGGLAADSDFVWFENGGGGASWVENPIATDVRVDQVVVADLDGDGTPDVLSARAVEDRVVWHANEAGDGSVWTEHVLVVHPGGSPVAVAADDVDGDGDEDAVVAFADGDLLAWYENVAGDGSAWTEHAVSTSCCPGELRTADVDGDGDVDVLAIGDDDLLWHENLIGDGTSWARTTIDDTLLVPVGAGDLDGDGDVDALSGTWGGIGSTVISWYSNDLGDGSAWTEVVIGTPFLPTSTEPADLDADGALDVLCGGFASDALQRYANAAGDGSAWVESPIWTSRLDSAPFQHVRDAKAADVDGDGDVDAVSAGAVAALIAWHENLGSAPCEFVVVGSPPNPDVLLPGVTSGPVLGATWDPVVDHSGFLTDAALDVLVVAFGHTSFPFGTGSILIGVITPTFGYSFPYTFSAAPGAPFTVAIPDLPPLAGVDLYSQALSTNGTVVELTNALYILIGKS